MGKPAVVYLSAGSNLGDRAANLRNGIEDLRKVGIVLKQVSSIFETEPVGFSDQPWFLNLAAEVETRLSPHELLACCLEIEIRRGRVRSFPAAPRTLDLDILLYDSLIIDQPGLQIPHPRMTHRRFVLEPLVQIAPGFLHPLLKKTIHELLDVCTDSSMVRLHSESAG